MKVTIVCHDCRSEEVTRDAWAEWDTNTQQWALGAVYDFAFCHNCQVETRLAEVSVAE